MFGINSIDQAGQIIEGWTNDLLNKEQDLFEKRMQVCRKCPLYNENNDRCDAKRCINPKTGEMSPYIKDGFICGCNCFMKKKTRVKRAKCVLGKWKNL